jgi:hypothetical protein
MKNRKLKRINRRHGKITFRQAQLLAESCYVIADAMIQERDKDA